MLNFLPDALPDSKSTLSEQEEEEEGRWALPDRAAAAVKRRHFSLECYDS